ncbi:MAG: FlgD immunoglobulin-like domain containing protein, partial [Pseudomonadota bacterium]
CPMPFSPIWQLADWVGKEVRTASAVSLSGSPVTLYPTIENGADRATVIVRNRVGDEVTQIPISTDGTPVEWAGVTTDGFPFPSGSYTFEVESYAGEELLGATPAQSYAVVTEVRRDASGANVVVLPGDVEVNANSVTALRNPT